MAMPWFALKVRAKAEALVESVLEKKSYETFLPTYTDCRYYSDRIKKIQAALFPGYLFCRFDPDRRFAVLNTLGVQHIVSFNGAPARIEDAEIAALKRVIASHRSTKPWPYLKAGDLARIEYGALSGVEGILVAEKGADLLVLSVSILQRSVAVQIDRAWIRPVQAQPFAYGLSA
jgi:transcription antitermination factor NusG